MEMKSSSDIFAFSHLTCRSRCRVPQRHGRTRIDMPTFKVQPCSFSRRYDMRLGASSNTFFYWCTDLSVFGRYSRRNMSSLATAFAPFAGWVYRTFPITKHSVFVSLISYAFSAAYLVGGCGSFRSRLWFVLSPLQESHASGKHHYFIQLRAELNLMQSFEDFVWSMVLFLGNS